MNAGLLPGKRWCRCLLVAGALMLSGCENPDTDRSITVTPDSIELTGLGTVLLTAAVAEDDELLLPLEWSVHNPSLGGILSSGGLSAVYESYGRRGQNVITVRDQSGREGIAAVTQR